jgi:hypothetical protein
MTRSRVEAFHNVKKTDEMSIIGMRITRATYVPQNGSA